MGRINANGVDLNRDFPDRLEDERTILLKSRSRQPETAALINWIKTEPFVLSANFHGGAVVASYPYDNSMYVKLRGLKTAFALCGWFSYHLVGGS